MKGRMLGRVDRDGKELWEGCLVVHDNGIRPVGKFTVDYDMGKVGWVLTGWGKDDKVWLREWSPSNVEIVEN